MQRDPIPYTNLFIHDINISITPINLIQTLKQSFTKLKLQSSTKKQSDSLINLRQNLIMNKLSKKVLFLRPNPNENPPVSNEDSIQLTNTVRVLNEKLVKLEEENQRLRQKERLERPLPQLTPFQELVHVKPIKKDKFTDKRTLTVDNFIEQLDTQIAIMKLQHDAHKLLVLISGLNDVIIEFLKD
jgi:hypothetical protein